MMGITLLVSLLMTAISFAERGDGLDEFDDHLDEFDDLELKSLVESLDSLKKIPAKKIDKGQKLILFDDNLYLLDDDFDFGEDELELQKLELDPNKIETAKEYVDSLNVFFEDELELQKLELDPYEIETAKEYVDSLNVFFEDSTQAGASSSSKLNQPEKSTPPIIPIRSRTGAFRFRSTPHDPTFSPDGANGFGVSTIVGTTMPITMKGIHIGYNYGIQIDTPVSFNIAGLEGNLGAEINFSSLTSFDFAENVKLASIIGNFSLFPNPSLEIKTGLGFTPERIQTDSTKYLTFSALSIPIDVNYYLPVDFSGQSNFTKFKVALNLHIQRTLADGKSEKWFGVDDGSYGYVHMGILIQFYQSFFH